MLFNYKYNFKYLFTSKKELIHTSPNKKDFEIDIEIWREI